MDNIYKLLDIMEALRDPQNGCPWDREQNFASIAPYTIEEAYEVADAIDRNDLPALRDELGDLLFQVVFHARMASEMGEFDFDDVAAAISDKMTRRHPHVFGDTKIGNADDQRIAWEVHKKKERENGAGEAEVLGGVTLALPALVRAVKLGKRAAGVGFDWPDSAGVKDKIQEELRELAEAEQSGDQQRIKEELGDLLFSVANLARHLNADAEEALRQANNKFQARFAGVEAQVSNGGRNWKDYRLDELEAFWEIAKSSG
jgi:ATP diphosphatase